MNSLELEEKMNEMGKQMEETSLLYSHAKKAEEEATKRQEIEAKQRLIDEKNSFLDQAKKHRALALASPTLKAREDYLTWAKEAEQAASEIVVDDGNSQTPTQELLTEINEPDEEQIAEQWNVSQIKKSLGIASVSFLAFVLFYFLSDSLETKFLNYSFDKLTQMALGTSLLSLGMSFIFFAWKKYFPILMHYLNDQVNTVYFRRDFLAASPEGRLYFLVALFYCFVSLLVPIIQKIING